MKMTSGFEVSVGGLTSNLKGMGLASLDNDEFCDFVLRVEKEDEVKYAYDGGGVPSSSLIYAVPVKEKAEELAEEEQGENVVVNLLMQLQAFQDGGNTIIRNSEMVKNQIIKQLRVEGEKLSSASVRNQIINAGNAAIKGKLSDDDYKKVISLVNQTVKKKNISNRYVNNQFVNNLNIARNENISNTVIQKNLYSLFKEDHNLFKNIFNNAGDTNLKYKEIVNNYLLKDRSFAEELSKRVKLNTTFTKVANETQDTKEDVNVVRTKNISVLNNENLINQVTEVSKIQPKKLSDQILNKTVATTENILRRKELVNVQKEIKEEQVDIVDTTNISINKDIINRIEEISKEQNSNLTTEILNKKLNITE
ncbi:MAG: hypothetical protein Q4B14_06735, partial [Clostridia bacterium]|nr:hypothetical protein [Clostridia bacterium]